MSRNSVLRYIFGLTLLLACGALQTANAQTPNNSFAFRNGQAVYIVAYQQGFYTTYDSDGSASTSTPLPRYEYNLDAEQKVRKRLAEWKYFRIVDRPADADFILFVHLNQSSMEALALPYDAYMAYFKEKVDFDQLRNASYGRYRAGPLKLSTVTRLSDRLVEDIREQIGGNKNVKAAH